MKKIEDLEQLKKEIESELYIAVEWTYNESDKAGEVCGDLTDHIIPIINKKIDEAFELGKKESKK